MPCEYLRQPRRRTVLRTLGGGSIVGLIGCTGLDTEALPTGTAKLAPADGDEGELFGTAVALAEHGDIALIGNHKDANTNGEEMGAAYVFTRANNEWREAAKLTAADGNDFLQFGWAVALADDGTTALVGARYGRAPSGESTGATYVFERTNGEWTQQTKLLPTDVNTGDFFGASVALVADGTIALIGNPDDANTNGEETGAAYVFARDENTWIQRARLAPANGDPYQRFGWSAALSGDGATALVGTKKREGGKAYVFARDQDAWAQQAALAPADGDEYDEFGQRVALAEDGTTALVSARQGHAPDGTRTGAAYVFEWTTGGWTQQVKLVPADGDMGESFGTDVALADDGNTALIGARGEDNLAGAAYVFARTDGDWSQQTKLVPADGDETDLFGSYVALAGNGSTALVSAYHDEDPNGKRAGSAYVFDL